MTLRVKHIPDNDPLYDAMLMSSAFTDALSEIDVALETQPSATPDLLFVGHKAFLSDVDFYMNQPVPLALHGSYDYGLVAAPLRSALESDHVVRLIQLSSYTTLEEHNAPWREGHRHGMYIAPSGDCFHPQSLTQDAVNKIRVWAGFAVTAASSARFGNSDIGSGQRAIKLHAVMNTFYTSQLITRHRNSALSAVHKFMEQDFSSVLFGRSTGDVRSMSHEAYAFLMKQCTAVLSPWGWGEYCIRDFEGALAGCVVIKPNTAFSTTWPRFEPGEDYVPCLADFSDLPQCIDTAIKCAENVGWRQSVQSKIREASNPRVLANRFKACLIE